MAQSTMKAVVFKGALKVEVEDRPVPTIEDPQDVILRVEYTALCGSELHVFRGHQQSDSGFIMGHEFTGIVTEVGSAVKTVQKGDRVVSPFTTACGACYYCKNKTSSRCSSVRLFGSTLLDGGQAEFVKVPLADGTLVKAPESIDAKYLVLMADIWPTGYFAASNGLSKLSNEQLNEATVAVIGCGPVGLCALINAAEYKPKNLFAIDGVESRLELARSLGAEPLNYQGPGGVEAVKQKIQQASEGRGADVVIEVVGLSPALRMAFDILRPWGFISSVGVHNGEIPWTGNEAYGKNLQIQMGRCPVRSIFPESLDKLAQKQHLLGFMTDKIMRLSEAVEGYDLFNSMKVQKVVFDLTTTTHTTGNK